MTQAVLLAVLVGCETECEPRAPTGVCNCANNFKMECDGCGQSWGCSASCMQGTASWTKSDIRCACIDTAGEYRPDFENCAPSY